MAKSSDGMKRLKHPVLKKVGIVFGMAVLAAFVAYFSITYGVKDEVAGPMQNGDSHKINDPEADKLEQRPGQEADGTSDLDDGKTEEEILGENDPNRWHDTTEPEKPKQTAESQDEAAASLQRHFPGYEFRF